MLDPKYITEFLTSGPQTLKLDEVPESYDGLIEFVETYTPVLDVGTETVKLAAQAGLSEKEAGMLADDTQEMAANLVVYSVAARRLAREVTRLQAEEASWKFGRGEE